jgi:thiamine pyrophosphate-dependent acetolactate synthase large subunit-like protein
VSSGGQEILYGKTTDERPAARNLNPQTPFDKIGEALGCKSATASKISEIESIVKDLSGKPAVLNLIVSNKPTHPGTVAMVDYTDDPSKFLAALFVLV